MLIWWKDGVSFSNMDIAHSVIVTPSDGFYDIYIDHNIIGTCKEISYAKKVVREIANCYESGQKSCNPW